MGLMKFLDKAFATYQKHLPEMMEYAEKLEERQQKKEERAEQRRQDNRTIINEYKSQFYALSDKELIAVIRSDETHWGRSAALEILKERGYEQDADNVWRKHI